MFIASRSFRPSSRFVWASAAGGVLALALARPGVGAPAPTVSPLLTPPPITILKSKPGVDRGLIFVAPKTTPTDGLQQGPEIIDDQGRPVWFQAVGANQQASNFRVQVYRERPVLTWWQGQNSPTGPGEGQGVNYVYDESYHRIATVAAGNGYQADLHEFRITPRGTAFITIYNHIPHDLSSVGGPVNGLVVDGVAQELDVATGKVVFEWHSIDHVPLSESQAPLPASPTAAYDYFHINAVNWDEDGNVIVDARNTWTTYKVDHKTGEIIWRLGGKSSTFALGAGVPFAWQHDPEEVGGHTTRIFDNEAAPSVLPYSRVIWVRRAQHGLTASLFKEIIHPDKIQAGSQGNAQGLPDDHTFVGWGATGRFSEFDGRGDLLFDANVPTGWDTYRAYRFAWHGAPDARPTASAQRNADGTVTVHALWNGATDIERWIVVGGARSNALWPAGVGAWNGLDTTITLHTDAKEIAVVAQDREGRLVGRSASVAVTP
jgi:Arylsulfotransferase (ASST)